VLHVLCFISESVLDMLCSLGECVYCICNVLWVNVGVGYVVLVMLLKFDEITTSALLNEAFSIYTTEKVIASIVLQVSNKLLALKNNNEVTMVQFQYVVSFLQNASRDGIS